MFQYVVTFAKHESYLNQVYFVPPTATSEILPNSFKTQFLKIMLKNLGLTSHTTRLPFNENKFIDNVW